MSFLGFEAPQLRGATGSQTSNCRVLIVLQSPVTAHLEEPFQSQERIIRSATEDIFPLTGWTNQS